MTRSSPLVRWRANWMFEPPVSTPTARMTAAAASRSSWYASSESVICGATVTESPVCTPIGSRFSIEHTTTTLSARSRITSSSNSSHPRTDSSTSTWPIGDSARPRSTWARSASTSSAKPPPCPPSVNAGRTTAGRGRSRRSSGEVTIRDAGTQQPAARHGRLELLAILRPPDDVDRSADELDAEVVENPSFGEPDSQVERGLPAEGRQQRIRALALEDRGDALEVERLDVGPVREPRVGHDRRRIRVDDHRPVAVLSKHLERLAAGVVELARLADDDGAGADHADALEVAPRRHQLRSSSTQDARIDQASWGPGPASGWNCTERARRSGKSRPSTVPS